MWVVEGYPNRFGQPRSHKLLGLSFEETYVDGLPYIGSSLGIGSTDTTTTTSTTTTTGSLTMYVRVKIGSKPGHQVAVTCHHVISGNKPSPHPLYYLPISSF